MINRTLRKKQYSRNKNNNKHNKHNKHNKNSKYIARSNSSKRTHKNVSKLHGGGDVSIYYKSGFITKIYASDTQPPTSSNISCERLYVLPEIHFNTKADYTITFNATGSNNKSFSFTFKYRLNSGIFGKSVKAETIPVINTVKQRMVDNFAKKDPKTGTLLIPFIIKISIQKSILSNGKTTTQPTSHMYFNLKPT